MKQLNVRGFTIIELLIAIVSFSLVLLIITGAIIQFSKVYYHGVITSKTQEVARTIAEDIARSAQFSPGVEEDAGCYLLGSQRYSYTIEQLRDETTPVLRVDSAQSCDDPIGTDATEMMGENMQLRFIDVATDPDNPSVRTITVTTAYGDDVEGTGVNSQCPAISLGGQFCAVSTITNTITTRLNQN